jgi:hypothetical protein
MHRRSKLTVLGRRLLVDRVIEQGWPVARAAEAQGISAATAYKWLRRWRAEGDQGLADRSSRPHRSPDDCPPSGSRRSWPAAGPAGSARTASVGRLGRRPPRCMRCCAATSCPGCGSSTGRPARWCATSASGLASCCTSTSSPKAGSRLGVATGCWGAQPAAATDPGSATTTCTWPSTTTPAWPTSRPTPRQDGQAAAGFTGRALAWFAEHGVAIQRVLTDIQCG